MSSSVAIAHRQLLAIFYRTSAQLGILAQQAKAGVAVPEVRNANTVRSRQATMSLEWSATWASELFHSLLLLSAHGCSVPEVVSNEIQQIEPACSANSESELHDISRESLECQSAPSRAARDALEAGHRQDDTNGRLCASAAIVAFCTLTFLFVCFTWLIISARSERLSAIYSSAAVADMRSSLATNNVGIAGRAEDMLGRFEVYTSSEDEGGAKYRRLAVTTFIAFFGFWAGAGASACHPVKSALLASL